jgi:uncharacterized protein involved in exopolysaccharide biosynthesis
MNRYIQTFFRHRLLLIAPLVIALTASLGYALERPHKYVAQATLWADSPLPADSSIVTGKDTPAVNQAAVLTELLRTRDFLDKVAHLMPAAGNRPATVPKSIVVATAGPQVITISVTATAPRLASESAKAVVDQFIAEVVDTRQQRGRALQDYYKQRLDAATKALTYAQQQLDLYVRAHPAGAGGGSGDPTSTQLASNVTQAQDQFYSAQDSLTKAGIDASRAGDSSQLRVVDQPVVPRIPVSNKKKIIFAGVGGFLAGGVISLLTLVLFVATDTSARQEADIEDALGLQVVGTVKQFPNGRRGKRQAS